MVSSISRNWIAGAASGMDTQGLIDKIMEAERTPLNALEKKRNTIQLQKSMLQEINLKLFEVQTKASDLVFSRTFNSKKVTSSNDKLLSAVADTSAKVGSYQLVVKQIATSTRVSSSYKLAAPIELGNNIRSQSQIGGSSLTIGAAGVMTAGNLDITISGGGTQTLSLGATLNTSVSSLVSSINSQINANTALKGKFNASYNEATRRIQFNLLDSSKTVTIADNGGSIMNDLFGASSVNVSNASPVKASTVELNSGLQTTMANLEVAADSKFTISRSTGESMTIDLTGVPLTTNVQDLVNNLNHQIDLTASFTKNDTVTGNPADREMEFRYDASSKRLQLVNTSSTDTTTFDVSDVDGDFSLKVFGASNKASTSDSGLALNTESFGTTLTSGTITIDGTQISVDVAVDSLKSVLDRITTMTNIRAGYDSKTDRILLTRKDGSSTPIGIGASTDTSNFLSVTGLISGNQATSAVKESTTSIGAISAIDANTATLGALSLAPAGTNYLRVTVNGVARDVAYSDTDTLNGVLDQIRKLDGIEDAYYDATTQKVKILTTDKGTSASLKIEDVGGGTLGSSLNINTDTATGTLLGDTMIGGRPLSSISTTKGMGSAGFATPITSGNFTINGVNFLISDANSVSLQTIIDTINNNTRVGVTAKYDPNSGSILLTSKGTGNTSISLGAPTDTSNFLSAVGLMNATQQIGQNAIYRVRGMFGDLDQVSQSNEIKTIATGLTVTLKAETDAAGETINLAADTTVARKAIDDFITSYNEAMTTIYTKLTEKRNYTLEALTETEKKALDDTQEQDYITAFKIGLLAGDSTLTAIRSRMRVVMAGVVSGADKTFDALADIGITTGVIGSGYQDTQVGLLKITDENKLIAALQDNPDKVAELFAKDSTSEGAQGIARRLKNALNEFTKSDGLLTRRVGRSGTSYSNSEMDKQISLINEQISRQEDRLTAREDALIKQFADLETAMSKYQQQSQAFQNQLASLSGK